MANFLESFFFNKIEKCYNIKSGIHISFPQENKKAMYLSECPYVKTNKQIIKQTKKKTHNKTNRQTKPQWQNKTLKQKENNQQELMHQTLAENWILQISDFP